MYVSYITQLNWKREDTNLFERPGKLNAYGIYFRIIRKISWGNRFNKQIAKSLMTQNRRIRCLIGIDLIYTDYIFYKKDKAGHD